MHDAVRAAVATPGPAGRPRAAVRVVDDTTASPGALRLRVAVPAPGTARIARADGTPVVGDVAEADGPGARLVVSRLEHVAGWELVRALGDHPSPLADLVTLDLFECQPGETRRPADRPPLATDGSCVLTYRRQLDGSWLAPAVFMQLQSHADQRPVRRRARPDRPLPLPRRGADDQARSRPPAGPQRGRPDAGDAAATGPPSNRGARCATGSRSSSATVDFEATSFTMQQLDSPSACGQSGRAPLDARPPGRPRGAVATSAPASTPHRRRRSPSGRHRRSSSRSASRPTDLATSFAR